MLIPSLNHYSSIIDDLLICHPQLFYIYKRHKICLKSMYFGSFPILYTDAIIYLESKKIQDPHMKNSSCIFFVLFILADYFKGVQTTTLRSYTHRCEYQIKPFKNNYSVFNAKNANSVVRDLDSQSRFEKIQMCIPFDELCILLVPFHWFRVRVIMLAR